jgi:hypothetical protein
MSDLAALPIHGHQRQDAQVDREIASLNIFDWGEAGTSRRANKRGWRIKRQPFLHSRTNQRTG